MRDERKGFAMPEMRGFKVGLFLLAGVGLAGSGGSQLAAQVPETTIRGTFPGSLHATGAGMARWYSAEQGGLERITGIPYESLGCSGCHSRGCEACHGPETPSGAGTPIPDPAMDDESGIRPPESQDVCLTCHFVVSREVRQVAEDPASGDVHFAAGMECMDCHTSTEVHGDGNAPSSFQAKGALEVNCEGCHTPLSDTPSHSVHGDGVDCTACHVRTVPTCYNCHFGDEGSGPSIPMDGFVFLLNQHGRVRAANLHTFVHGDRTMITFAPFFPHTVMREGRACGECHGTDAARWVLDGAYRPVVMGAQGPENRPGVIPVGAGVEWGFPFLRHDGTGWVLLEDPEAPLINFAGFGTPLTSDQLRALASLPGSGSVPSRNGPNQ